MFMFILRGVSGSGKSIEAKKIAEKYPSIICSTDDWFVKDGVYFFDKTKLAKNHKKNQDLVRAVCSATTHNVIVDNTNINKSWYKVYETIAKEYGYSTVIVYPDNDLWNSFKPGMSDEELKKLAEKFAARNKHNVTEEIIFKQLKRWEF